MSMATAQEAESELSGYGGVSLGVASVLIVLTAPVSVHAGFGTEGLGGRIDGTYFVTSPSFQIAANLMHRGGPVVQGNTLGYGGGGARLLLTGEQIVFGLGGLGGGEHIVSENVGLFGEGRLDLYFAGGFAVPVIGVAFGVNFHF
jgi:hypothetical protein